MFANKRFLYFVVAFAALGCLHSEAAPRRYGEEDNSSFVRELRDGLEDIKHEVTNHDAELRMFQEKLANQDSTVENLRQQMLDTNQAHKEQLKGHIEAKIANLESVNKGLVADLKLLKDHSNESAAALEQYNQKLSKIEKILDSQAQNMSHLESALQSLMEALQIKDHSDKSNSIAKAAGKSYKVKPGDSLGKIAIDHKTSTKTLRELNPQIENDKIIVGQTLHIP